MNFELRRAQDNELEEALAMLKEAAENLRASGVDQWAFWLNPTQEKINWIAEGFRNKEFFFIVKAGEVIGMVRVLSEDRQYWGQEPEAARYIHSLVIKKKYAGHQLGERVLAYLGEQARGESVFILRLDCNAANRKLCAYYERQGFVKVREKQTPDSLNNLYEKRLK